MCVLVFIRGLHAPLLCGSVLQSRPAAKALFRLGGSGFLVGCKVSPAAAPPQYPRLGKNHGRDASRPADTVCRTDRAAATLPTTGDAMAKKADGRTGFSHAIGYFCPMVSHKKGTFYD